uniref:ANK_REP_REGION domain-containing protein n=1 Tax=Globodera pallida TaxID=36090 RepID=A0A183C5J0_GLOPA
MIQKALKALYGNTLKHYIKNEKALSAEYQELLYDLIDANRDEIFCNDQYQAEEDALTLKEGGVDKNGTDKGKFIRILSNANLLHLHLVIEKYNLLRYMSSFEADIKEEFSEPLKSGLLAIGENNERCPAYYYTKQNDYIMAEAKRLYKAFHVLVRNNNAQIRAITRAYNVTYGHRKPKITKNQKSSRSLRDRIKDELKDDVELLALDLLEGNRNEQQNFVPDCEKAENQAAELLHPGKGVLFNFARRFTKKIGVNVFIAILANEHFKQLRLIFEMYKKNSGTNGSAIDVIKEAIDKITNSTTLKLGLKTIVDLAVQKVNNNELEKILNDCKKLNDEQQIENLSDEYYVTDAEKDAALLRKAMQGWGTNEKTLIWILTTRKNNREISEVYKTMYGNELLDRIKEETSGVGESNFQDVLKQLLGSTREDSPTFKPDKIKAKKQAVELFNGNGTKFVNIMATMHSNQLLLIFDEKKFDGDFLRTLLAIVSLARKGIDETERVLQKDAQEMNWIKKFWHYLVDLYKGYKPVTESELNEYNDFVKYCDEGGSDAHACSTTITPEDKYRIRDLHEKYFTKKITRSLKDLLGIFKMPSTKERAKIDLHRVIIARYQHDLGDILRSIDRLSLKQIVDRFESWHFTFGELANGKLFETEDKLYAHALKKLLNIENAKQITGYEDFLENYGPNLQDFMEKIQNDQYEFGIEMKKPKKGEDERVSVNIHLYNLPKPPDGTSVSNQYENVPKKELRKPANLAKYMSESKFMHDLLQIMSQDLIDRLDLMYRARLKKALLAKDDVNKFEQRILGNPEVMENLIDQWKRGQQKHQSYNENIENIKPALIEMEMNPEKSSESYKYQVWNIWGEAKEKPTRQAITTQLYIDHVNVFKLLFWARFYALAIALQRVPMQMANDGEAKGVGKKESAQLFGMEYDRLNNLVESAELGATFRLDIPHEAWPDETRQATEEMRKKFEQDLDCLEEYILYNFNHQMFYGGQPRFYQVGYETLLKLGYDDVLKGTKLRTLLVHEMEEMLEEVDSGVNKENDDDFSLKTVHFTKVNVQLFKKREGEEKLHSVQKWIQKAFTWLDGLVDKMHKKSLTKRNRMQRYLFEKMQTFTSELRGLFTGQTPPIKWIMKKCMPMLYYGAKYGKKLLKGVGKLFKPMLSIFKSSKEKTGYKHKKSRLESKKAMFGLLLEIDSAVQDNTKMKNNWRGKSNAIWANDKEMERIWATEINKVKVDDKDKVSEDDREEMIGMIKDGSEVPWWMVKVKPPRSSATAKKETSKVNSRRKKRLAIRKAIGTDNVLQRFATDGVQSTVAAPFAVADDAVDNARHRRRKRFSMGGRAMAARSMARRAYSPSYHPFGGSYYMGYHYYPYNCYYYRPYHLTHKQLMAELWTIINIFAAFIVVPISAAFWDLDCSSSGSSSSSYYGGSYHYDYTAAQKLREKAEKKRIKQEKESELDYQIADWNKEISYGTKQNKSGHRRKKRSSAGMDSKIVGWQTEDSFGLNKNDERHRRTKRSVAQDCGAYIGTLIFLLWIIVWIGGYFLIAFGPI